MKHVCTEEHERAIEAAVIREITAWLRSIPLDWRDDWGLSATAEIADPRLRLMARLHLGAERRKAVTVQYWQARAERAEASARSAHLIVAALVKKAGGEVTLTAADLETADIDRVERVDDGITRALTFRTRPTQEKP
jgi:hypothetical protein